jgi:hypothetical protein
MSALECLTTQTKDEFLPDFGYGKQFPMNLQKVNSNGYINNLD